VWRRQLAPVWLTRLAGGAGDPFALPLRAGSSLRLKNGYAQDDTVANNSTALQTVQGFQSAI